MGNKETLVANRSDAKLKLLMVMRALFEETDADHGLTVDQIIEWLDARGVQAERKSVLRDIKVLREFGFNIARRRAECATYRLIDPLLSTNQWEMVVDAVQSSPCLDESKTFDIVDGLSCLVSRHQREQLDRKLELPMRVKMDSDLVPDHLSIAQEALRKKMQVSFRYVTWNTDGGPYEHFGGGVHQTTPVAVVYATGFYYLVAFEERHEGIAYYRLDRMRDLSVTDEPATRHEKIANYRVDDEGIIVFGPYTADKMSVELRVARRFIGAVVDRFGWGINIRPDRGDPENHAIVRVSTTLTPMFYSWLLGFGDGMVIAKPKRAREEYVKYLEESLCLYKRDISQSE